MRLVLKNGIISNRLTQGKVYDVITEHTKVTWNSLFSGKYTFSVIDDEGITYTFSNQLMSLYFDELSSIRDEKINQICM